VAAAAQLERLAVPAVGDGARQQHGRREPGRRGEPFRAAAVLRGRLRQASGEGPHAVRDGAREAEQPRRQRVQVDRVAVA